jgi:hypothetical protein
LSFVRGLKFDTRGTNDIIVGIARATSLDGVFSNTFKNVACDLGFVDLNPDTAKLLNPDLSVFSSTGLDVMT